MFRRMRVGPSCRCVHWICLFAVLVPFLTGSSITAQHTLRPNRSSLHVSAAFNSEIMVSAQPIEIVHQNIIEPWIDTRAKGTLARLQLTTDVTLQPGLLYEATVSQGGLKVDVLITNSPGYYPAGSIIRTNAQVNTVLLDARAIIESATVDASALRLWAARRRLACADIVQPLVALGWERSWLRRVRNPEHPGHRAAIAQGCLALDIIHETWPEAAVSFYGFPWGTAAHTEEWEQQTIASLLPMLARVDWFGPSIYDKVRDADTPQAAIDRQRRIHESSLRISASVAAGRPILPWIRHRYFNVGAPYHNNLINKTEFQDDLRWAWNFHANRESIDGFILWYRDRENWNNAQQSPPEATGQPVPQVLDEIEAKYYGYIQAVMHGH